MAKRSDPDHCFHYWPDGPGKPCVKCGEPWPEPGSPYFYPAMSQHPISAEWREDIAFGLGAICMIWARGPWDWYWCSAVVVAVPLGHYLRRIMPKWMGGSR